VLVCQGGFTGDGGLAKDATLSHAAAVALDADGTLYIADTINRRIRRVEASTGFIQTIVRNGGSGFSGDGGPALDSEITFPTGIAVDLSGRVYFRR
jgi:sugar lactone lactonase YvrE